ncbi:MAG: YciI family protein [Pseudomonadota bacterium]
MKSVVIGIGSGETMAAIMAVYPRHKIVLDAFVARGEVIGIGPFVDQGGNLAIFRSREAAESFVAQDPFILEGVIESYEVRDWADKMLT